jgi:cytochrome P450
MLRSIQAVETAPFWQQVQWVADPISYMENAAQKYPDIFSSKIVSTWGKLIFVNDAQAIQEILTNDRKQFAAPGELNEILTPIVGNNSVITLSGDRHKKRRQLVMPAFHGSRMQHYGELIAKLTRQSFEPMLSQPSFAARDVMQNISLQVILQTVFGLYEGDRLQKLKSLISKLTEAFNSPLTSAMLFFPILQKNLGKWSPWGSFVAQREQIDQLIYAEIRDRRANLDPERTDILTMLLLSNDVDGNALSDIELRDELMALLFAGHETTSTAISWALYWIARSPEVKSKLLHELAQEEKNNQNQQDWMSIFKLPYLTAVCNETLRIHPVAMLTFPRIVTEPTIILDAQLEPNDIVMGCIYLLHHREDLYPESQKFKPERFLERQFSPYEFMPFGGGARRCVGEALAQFEMKIILATILRHYQLTLTDNQPVKPQRRGVTLAPKGGVKMQAIPASTPFAV